MNDQPQPQLLVDEGLGNTGYLLDLGDGRALVVDVSRDLRAVHAAAGKSGLRIAFAADTHLHADFLSGGLELAAEQGTRILASAAGGREFPHRGLADGEDVDLGGLTLRALSTPGHTHEHVAFQLLDGSRTLGVFTGGSLLVGSAARTDLLGPDRTEELARLQYRSLQRLATLPDETPVWPTHGAGSFCSAPPGSARTTTIGTEKATNALLRAESEDAFVAALIGSLGSYPAYFDRLGELNRRGPAVHGIPGALSALDPGEVRRLQGDGAEIVDVRPLPDYARGHIPGSLSNPLRPVFATWLGWLVEPDRPLVIVRDPDQDPAEILGQAIKIGYDGIVGELSGGMATWTRAELPVSSIPLRTPDEVGSAQVLDVRQDNEYAAGHLPGAIHVELGDLPTQMAALPAGPTVVMCGHGERAMGAASLLARHGRTDVAVLAGGPEDWAEASGRRLEVGA
jgi:rhodanese-related sulfurtransferase/glyoxylase-like metal-dependent hydrolase (beta-lactamase superfamily II)